jgi:hypothetical protein
MLFTRIRIDDRLVVAISGEAIQSGRLGTAIYDHDSLICVNAVYLRGAVSEAWRQWDEAFLAFARICNGNAQQVTGSKEFFDAVSL